MQKEHITDLLTTIETLTGYALETCNTWEPDPEDNSNFPAEAFLFAIKLMAKEAKGYVKSLPTADQ